MAQSYAKLQEKQRFDDLMNFLDGEFQHLPDHRTGNATRYELADVLKSAFAMSSLKSPFAAGLQKANRSRAEQFAEYLSHQGRNSLRQPDARHPLTGLTRSICARSFTRLSSAWLKRASSTNIGIGINMSLSRSMELSTFPRPECIAQAALGASNATARPPITTRDWRRSCSTLTSGRSVRWISSRSYGRTERKRTIASANAAKRLCKALAERYVLNVKPDSHPSLEKQFAGRRASGQVMESRITDSEGAEHYFAWTCNLCLCESATDVKVNYLLYEQTDKRGKVTRWTWITNLQLARSTVEKVMRALRSNDDPRLWSGLA